MNITKRPAAAGAIAGVYGSDELPKLVPPIRQKAFMTAVYYMVRKYSI